MTRAELSPSQKEAVSCPDGPALVLAGPGSGKTFVITQRILYLIREKKIPADRILVITFSRAAAKQMRERFKAVCPDAPGVVFGTFHAVFFQILKKAYHFTPSSILQEEEKNSLIGALARRSGLPVDEERDLVSALAAEISLVKNEQIPLEHYYSTVCTDTIFRDIYAGYNQALTSRSEIDFDDILVLCRTLLKEREDILAHWQRCFSHILADEFQDINQIQYDILRMLAKPEDNLFAVGDDDQSIYRFRGARPEIMLGFEKDYPEARMFCLKENYRSAPVIVEAAGKVIAANRKRYVKDICPARVFKGTMEVQRFSGAEQEADFMIGRIRKSLAGNSAPGEIAVLFRTRREGRYYAEKFWRAGVPFVMKELTLSVYDHWICRDLSAYLRLAGGELSRKDFLQIMNHPLRYLSRSCLDTATVSFDRLRYWYDDQPWMLSRIDELEQDLQTMGRLRPYAAVNYLRRKMGYEAYVREYALSKGIPEDELLAILEELQESCAECAEPEEWFLRIGQFREEMHQKARHGIKTDRNGGASSGENRPEDGVVLATLHAAKGLEFEEVFLPGLNEGVLPGKKAKLEEDIEEERRLFYVGMTRAKKRLHISCLKERFGREMKPSRFLKELLI